MLIRRRFQAYALQSMAGASARHFGALGGDGDATPKKISIKKVSIPQRPIEDEDDAHPSGQLTMPGPPEEQQDVVKRQQQLKTEDVDQLDPLDAAMSAIKERGKRQIEDNDGEIDTTAMLPTKPKGAAPKKKRTMDDVLGDVLTEAINMKDQGQKPDVDTIYKKTQERLYEAEYGRKAPSGNTQEMQRKYLPFPPVLGMYRLEPIAYLTTDEDVLLKDIRRQETRPVMRRYVSPSAQAAPAPSPSPSTGSMVKMNFSKKEDALLDTIDQETRQANANVFEREGLRKSQQLEEFISSHEDPWPIRAITIDNPVLNRHDADAKEAARLRARQTLERKVRSLEAELIRLCGPHAAPNIEGKSVESLQAEVQSIQDELATNPVYLDDHATMYSPRIGFNAVEEFSDAVDEHFYWEQQFIQYIRDAPLWQRRSFPFLHEHYRLVTHRLVRAEARFIACRDKALASVKANPKMFAETEARIDRSRMLCADTHKSLSSPNYDPLRMKKKSFAGTLMGMSEAAFAEWLAEERGIKNTLIAALSPE